MVYLEVLKSQQASEEFLLQDVGEDEDQERLVPFGEFLNPQRQLSMLEGAQKKAREEIEKEIQNKLSRQKVLVDFNSNLSVVISNANGLNGLKGKYKDCQSG